MFALSSAPTLCFFSNTLDEFFRVQAGFVILVGRCALLILDVIEIGGRAVFIGPAVYRHIEGAFDGTAEFLLAKPLGRVDAASDIDASFTDTVARLRGRRQVGDARDRPSLKFYGKARAKDPRDAARPHAQDQPAAYVVGNFIRPTGQFRFDVELGLVEGSNGNFSGWAPFEWPRALRLPIF